MMSYRRQLCGVFVAVAAGCGPTKPIDPPKPMYSDLGPKDVSEFLKRTVWEQTDLANAGLLRVSGFGLVVNLDGTGDTRAPNPVREYMTTLMQKHGVGSTTGGVSTVAPERMLSDPDKRTAIVRVDGFIPPGAHQGQGFDVQVSALENSNTTSLHHGELYETELGPRGADPFIPKSGIVNPMARVLSGPIAINPAYALDDSTPTLNQKLSMRYGVVMNRGVVADERPLVLKLRQPERRLAKQIENRINERFQGSNDERFGPDTNPDVDAARRTSRGSRTAVAKDEGEIWLYVPYKYGQDWEHFIGLAMHLYFNPNADFASLQAKKLADIARADGDKAPLRQLSYCWEALGEPAIPAVATLYASPVPAVAYAAARAGAFLGDIGAQDALARMARTAGHPSQIDAVKVLGALPTTAQLRLTLRGLIDSEQLLVRIAAYEAMIATGDPIVVSRMIGVPPQRPQRGGTSGATPPPPRGRFILDLIQSDGPPIIYATRVGEPRIAVIGRPAKVRTPGLLMAMNDRLTLMTDSGRDGVKVYYRGDKYAPGVTFDCQEDVAVLIARLGGEAVDATERLRFHYTDVVGLIKKMIDTGMVVAADPRGGPASAVFHQQSLPGVDDPILSAPSIPEQRPQDVPATQNFTRAFPGQ